jgi:hypothetical protein
VGVGESGHPVGRGIPYREEPGLPCHPLHVVPPGDGGDPELLPELDVPDVGGAAEGLELRPGEVAEGLERGLAGG